MKTLPFLILGLATAATSAVRGARPDEIGFVEKFVLADSREAVLAELVPGTEDYYYFHALHYQHESQQDALRELLENWRQRNPGSALRKVIENRSALLDYERDPNGTIEYLKRELGLRFDHAKPVPDAERNVPNSLDPARISADAFHALAVNGTDGLQNFTDSGLDWLARSGRELTPTQRRELLSRLDRPDYPGIVDLVVADLRQPGSPAFGSLAVHQVLLLDQMDALRSAVPDIAQNEAFVFSYLSRLAPGPDVRLETDVDARTAYLERAWAFVEPLVPTFNSLKAHLLYARLGHDRALGAYDRERFLAYLRLPRPVPYVSPRFRENAQVWSHPVDLSRDFAGVTRIPPIIIDEPLVREYLLHFLREDANYDAFAEFIHEPYLKRLFAEAKITSGQGNPEQWASYLPPAEFAELRDRVDLDFAPTNAPTHAPTDAVELALDVKNVRELIVKVYELNAANFYREEGRELNTDINLDGLVANSETSHQYEVAPFARVRRAFSFPSLANRRGAWIIEFIGNGRSSRALIRKGTLRSISRTGAAGQVVTVLDESNAVRKDATAWLEGVEYRADEEGRILVPYSTNPGSKPLILGDATGFAALETFVHEAEAPAFSAGFHVERESLLAGGKATVAIRPHLRANGAPASLDLLEDPTLTISALDLDGISTSTTITALELEAGEEFRHQFNVPRRLQHLTFTLSGTFKRRTDGQRVPLSASREMAINAIDATDLTSALFLSEVGGSHLLQMLGKTGEPRPDSVVNVAFHRNEFTQPVHAELKTDAQGIIRLGGLDGIARVEASAPGCQSHLWMLAGDRALFPAEVHAVAGQVVSLPYVGGAAAPDRAEVSLLAAVNGMFTADRFDAVSISDGFLRLSGLEAGDYSLRLKRPQAAGVTIRVTDGEVAAGHLVSDARILEGTVTAPLHVRDLRVAGEELEILLANASPWTRVHLATSRFVHRPDFDLFNDLSAAALPGPRSGTLAFRPNAYLSGRDIGDEFRYILERRGATVFPGNMLSRPALILNPWELRTTETGEQVAQAGEEWAEADAGADAAMAPGAAPEALQRGAEGDHHNVDFLADSGVVVYNLAPDENGRVAIPLDKLGDRQHVHVLAVDSVSATYRTLTLPERNTAVRDLRLADVLDPQQRFTRQTAVAILPEGGEITWNAERTSEFRSYRTLSEAHGLLATLSGNGILDEFRFLTEWPDLAPERKRELYSKHACHELSFFLQRKDPGFFDSVIRPYLANKKEKTFLDFYLLQGDLTPWLEAWKFGQLNTFERILLGRVFGDHGPAIRRNIGDAWQVVRPPDDIARLAFFRSVALRDRGLAEDAKGVVAFALADKEAVDGARRLLETRSGAIVANGVALDELAANMPQAAAAPAPSEGERRSLRRKASAREMESLALAEELEEQAGAPARGARRAGRQLAAKDAAALGGALAVNEKFAMDADLDFGALAAAQALFRPLEATREWAENQYWHVPIDQLGPELVPVNRFWLDYANWDGTVPFLSEHLGDATGNTTQLLLALAVLDLPFSADEPVIETRDTMVTLRSESPVLAFRREVRPADPADAPAPLLVSQAFYRKDDAQEVRDGRPVDKFVSGEFLTGVVYGCKVVLSNPSSTPRVLNVLTQIPEGSLPVAGTQRTADRDLELNPYSTTAFDFFFYFPAAGTFRHYPVHVAEGEKVVASADPATFTAVDSLSDIDRTSWPYIARNGSDEQVLEYLREANLFRTNLDEMAWRLKENEPFFTAAVDLLVSRHFYHPTTFSYGIAYNRRDVAASYLRHADGFVAQCGPFLASPLVTIDPVERRSYEHLEYSPLVNARAHKLGANRTISNSAVHGHYHALLDILATKGDLDHADRMALVYYLVLQDRVAEALRMFDAIDAGALPTRIQYDYLAAYLAFYREDPEQARTIASAYADYPVDRWKARFAEIVGQLDELQGTVPEDADPEDRAAQQDALAAKEPALDTSVEGDTVTLNYRNIDVATVNYYEMDLEFLFSASPFLDGENTRFSYIKPNRSELLQLDPKLATEVFKLPREYQGRNVLVEVTGGGKRDAIPVFATRLEVTLTENAGLLRIAHAEDKRPLPKVYVKVYARTENGPKFYKDGYSDLRGKFDYASLSRDELGNVSEFSILVLSPDHGATVLQTRPPAR